MAGCNILKVDGASSLLLINVTDHLILFNCIPGEVPVEPPVEPPVPVPISGLTYGYLYDYGWFRGKRYKK